MSIELDEYMTSFDGTDKFKKGKWDRIRLMSTVIRHYLRFVRKGKLESMHTSLSMLKAMTKEINKYSDLGIDSNSKYHAHCLKQTLLSDYCIVNCRCCELNLDDKGTCCNITGMGKVMGKLR